MITNLPNNENFKQLARDCLIQTINNLYQIFENFNFNKREGNIDFGESELWQYHKGDLRTCLILVYQGLELYLKAEICKESPLLLIETTRSDWPTNPNSIDKDFNELFTISGEALIRTFNALYIKDKNKQILNSTFDRIRKRRNIITHSSPNFSITPKKLIENSVLIISLFEGPDKWWSLIKENNVDHPLFGYGDYDYELAHLLIKLEFIKNNSSFNFLNEHSTIDLKSRRYYCPYCTRYLGDIGWSFDETPKWTFLNPNTPTSEKVTCYSCQQTFTVERFKCTSGICKGNVIDIENWSCLTCYEDYERE